MTSETNIRFMMQKIETAQCNGETHLDLSYMNITELPEAIVNIKHLESLDLKYNQLTELLESIGKLTQLRKLNLSWQNIKTLSETIRNLTQLESLNLSGNKLTKLPDSIGNLNQLLALDLSWQNLTELPDSIGNLTQLKFLNLRGNRLTEFPDSIGKLSHLESLDLRGNRLTKLPESIGKLARLKYLYLSKNQLTKLPESIGNLTNLNTLSLDQNNLTDLPISIGNLSHLPSFSIQNNPLNPDLAAAFAEGMEVFWQFLRQRAKESVVLHEAKLILVGEGGVGKSSLLGALRNEPWLENRDTTHGVEIKPVLLNDPGSSVELILNSWDFGGQPVYRPTHQLFFSAPALYLVTWKPRQGPEQGFVSYWTNLIKHRTYNEKRPEERPRILVVATHGGPKERQAHIDEEALRKQFGDLIVGFYHIDSYTKDGLEKLKNDIAAITAAIPQVGRRVPGNWKRLMDSLKKRSKKDAYITYKQYEDIFSHQKINQKLAVDYANMLNRLGHIIHYGDDPALKDIVILKAEWLSKAISFALEDRQVKEQNGLVNHLRLAEIWNDPDRSSEERYCEDLHPIFLRLMERFDLSYRVLLPISGGVAKPHETSLIAQLVPGARPEGLVEDWGPEPEPGDVQRTQVCRIIDAETGISAQAEGLIYQLIVRFHPYSMGRHDYTRSRHWQQGLLLDDEYNGRVLLEQIGNDIHITVRAAYPERFLHMVSREIKCLVEQGWKGLDCRIAVPCPRSCKGLFEIDALINARRKNRSEYPCNICGEWVNIDSLLTKPTMFPQWDVALAELKQGQQEIKQSMQTGFQSMRTDLRRLISMADERFTEIMTNLSDEARDGPRLFSLTPLYPGFWNKPGWLSQKIRVTLWCEHSRLPLPELCKEQTRGVYEFDQPRKWLVKVAPYVRFVAGTLRLILPVAGSAVKWALDDAEYKKIDEDLDLSQKTFIALLGIGKAADKSLIGDHKDDLPDVDLQDEPCDENRYGRPMLAQAGLLRELHALIEDFDPSFGGLVRVRNKRGEFLWVHPDFQKEY
jgi:Leucine-rich repeat (LRR) protein